MSVPPAGSDLPPEPTPGYIGAGTPQISQEERTMAMLAYILGIFTGFLGPLVIWLMKKDQSKFVAFHGIQALILHAVVVIGYILSSFLMFLLIGFLTYPAFFILGLVYSILAGMAANRGEWYDIPVIAKTAHQQAGV